jgi:hypothetical protein
MFGDLELVPSSEIAGLLRIRNHPVVATGDAILLRGIRAYEPIANIEGGIGAKAIKPFGCGECGPIRPTLFERGQNILVWKVAKPVEAVPAGAVLEVEKLSATVALEQFHRLTTLMSTIAVWVPIAKLRTLKSQVEATISAKVTERRRELESELSKLAGGGKATKFGRTGRMGPVFECPAR